ncbi:MAG: Eco57I restriction-modification methylase domain-containing protein, partial [Dehalococcoidia bacterium]
PLIEEVAYEQWHRMLFARFLIENRLLIHPGYGEPVSFEECRDLAKEEGEPDAWSVAAKYAAAMLPGIFRLEDPSARVRFAPEGREALERIVAGLSAPTFTADDALGWVYQFWQSKKKKEVNQSGRKIGGADIAPVTQLFTEDYMVRFLLENSLGAWWAARHPQSPLLKQWQYLRFRDDGTPAAGTFPGWPERAADVTVMDPCCGSGHFLVAAFEMLRQMRMEEEGLDGAAAADAVLRDNLFGLEIDPRCTQIAVFALALAAWKADGYRALPPMSIACSGIPVQGQLHEWLHLAGNDPDLRYMLEQLYQLFKDAPDLGSLIDPNDIAGQYPMLSGEFAKVLSLLQQALRNDQSRDPAAEVFGAAAEGAARAASMLAGKYELVATNVPYLGIRKMDTLLKDYAKRNYSDSKSDLATVFTERTRSFCNLSGVYALVTPQNWLAQVSYQGTRKRSLQQQTWLLIARLDEGAFTSSAAAGAFPVLLIIQNSTPFEGHQLVTLDCHDSKGPENKCKLLLEQEISAVRQFTYTTELEQRVTLQEVLKGRKLGDYTVFPQGIKTGDDPLYRRYFWEIPHLGSIWKTYQGSTTETVPYAGREKILNWSGNGKGMIRPRLDSVALSKQGVAISQMRSLPVTLYTGERFDSNVAPVIPRDPDWMPALWTFLQSAEFKSHIRTVETSIKINNGTIGIIPFDLERWQKAAEEQYPNGLPEPYSNDLTQWLFEGLVTDTTQPLQVAVARLLGYSWPEQAHDGLQQLAAEDGILPLVPVVGHQAGAERLRTLLAAAHGEDWSAGRLQELLAGAGFGGKTLDEWLRGRDGFFKQHCTLFHDRPFIWQIWDGLADGFSALVNYHQLDRRRLESLAYSYLGGWIETQDAGARANLSGAERRRDEAKKLQQKLALILEGEDPYDIYVRWKPLAQQPIGWEPDLNDGVRMNIRPFMTADVLHIMPNINWCKDGGANPDGSERLNDLHLKLAEKRAARGG